jgi:hypothetical protein
MGFFVMLILLLGIADHTDKILCSRIRHLCQDQPLANHLFPPFNFVFVVVHSHELSCRSSEANDRLSPQHLIQEEFKSCRR